VGNNIDEIGIGLGVMKCGFMSLVNSMLVLSFDLSRTRFDAVDALEFCSRALDRPWRASGAHALFQDSSSLSLPKT
jgi:hypothetical protein